MSACATVRLSDQQIAFFDENGFLAVESLLDEDDLRPLEQEYDLLLDRTALGLHRNGEIPSRFAELPFGERFTRILAH